MDRDVEARVASVRSGTKAFEEAMDTYVAGVSVRDGEVTVYAGRTDTEAVAAARCFFGEDIVLRYGPQLVPMEGD
jgi:hypothetical protein